MSTTIHHEQILNMFDKIRVLTIDLLQDFSIKKFQDTLNERSVLLSSIRNEIELQKSTIDNEQISESLNSEYDTFLHEIRKLDLSVMSVIQSKMDEIKLELRGLANNSSAALAYMHHKRG